MTLPLDPDRPRRRILRIDKVRIRPGQGVWIPGQGQEGHCDASSGVVAVDPGLGAMLVLGGRADPVDPILEPDPDIRPRPTFPDLNPLPPRAA